MLELVSKGTVEAPGLRPGKTEVGVGSSLSCRSTHVNTMLLSKPKGHKGKNNLDHRYFKTFGKQH